MTETGLKTPAAHARQPGPGSCSGEPLLTLWSRADPGPGANG